MYRPYPFPQSGQGFVHQPRPRFGKPPDNRHYGPSPSQGGFENRQYGPPPSQGRFENRQYGPPPSQGGFENRQYGPPPSQGGFRGSPLPHHGFIQTATKEYWCETCDRDFHSSQQLDIHKQQHQKCNIDGCQFIAHPKIVTLHIQMQHSTGLYKKIAKLNDPEEIRKWREERKLKYPTKSNIEKNAAVIQEKIKRGEKMCLKRERNIQRDPQTDYKQNNNFKNQRSNKFNNTNKQQNHRKRRPAKIPKIIAEHEEGYKLKPFAGIQALIASNESDDEDLNTSPNNFQIDDDDEVCNDSEYFKTQSVDKVVQPAVCGALNNLICNYGTSDEEAETKENLNQEKQNGKIKQSQVVAIVRPPEIKEEVKSVEGDNDSGPDEVKTTKINVEPNSNQSDIVAVKKDNKKGVKKPLPQKKGNYNTFKPKPQSTLLQKLLFREMRQERNMVLQCIRHIVKNNYFEE